MEATNPNKHNGNLFDDAAEEFPFDDCSGSFSNAQGSESEAVVNPNGSSVNEDSRSASLRRRRSLSYNASGNDAVVSSSSLTSTEKNLRFPRKSMEMEKDNNVILNDIKNSNSMQLDSSTVSQKSTIDEENKQMSTIMNGSSVITGDFNYDRSCLDEGSAITDVNNDEIDNSEVVDSNLRGSDDFSSFILFDLASLLIKAFKFQVNLLITLVRLMIKLFTLPVWVIYSSYMFVMDPFQIMRRGKRYVMHKTTSFLYEWLKQQNYVWRLGLKFGWGCLWSVYVCVILLGLLVSAFVMGGILMRIMVQEPIRMMENLNFDYTAKSPVAYVPVIRSPGVTCGVDSKDHVEVSGMVDGVRVIPPNHHLQVTVLLTLPESDYNRNLGIFQVRVDFLTANGKVLASSRRPCMLQFKSHPIRLLSTFLKVAPLVTGYTSESQKLKVNLKGFTEGFIPTACLRVTIEQRAEFRPGGGIPEMYTASLALESELPFLKRMLWYWRTTLFVWVSMLLFAMEFLFALLCCKPLIIPRLRRRHDSNNRTGSQSNPPIER